jgi:hypothetical protein
LTTSTKTGQPEVQPGGLVTLAYLKARLDEGHDHLGIFMPLVIDVIPRLPQRSFTAVDVRDAIASAHGVAMPQEAVATLLRRLGQNLVREAGRYHLNADHDLPRSNVRGKKQQLERGQLRLGEALQRHAEKRGLSLASPQVALDMLLRLIEREQVPLLLGDSPRESDGAGITRRECIVAAEFLQEIVTVDTALTSVLQAILEGLVLYHSAFLPDLGEIDRNFKDLHVIFDSGLVRQALGYEGESARTLVLETIRLLRNSGVACIVFDKTILEIRRILAMYAEKLASDVGRRSLWPLPMTRHFLTSRYAPSDVRELSALLDQKVAEAGFEIIDAPMRLEKYTSDEASLAVRLASAATNDTSAGPPPDFSTI